MEAAPAHRVEHAADRGDARPRERDVVTEQLNVAALAAEVALHVDDDHRRVVGPELAIPRPGIGGRRDEARGHGRARSPRIAGFPVIWHPRARRAGPVACAAPSWWRS